MIQAKVSKGRCILIPYGYVVCEYSHQCNFCDIAYRIRENLGQKAMRDEELFRWCDALPMTKKMNGVDFYRRVVILKPDVLRANNIPANLLYQMFFCDGGSGVFFHNPAGLIEGYLVADRTRRLQINRHGVYGIPKDSTVERYFDIFRINLDKEGTKMK